MYTYLLIISFILVVFKILISRRFVELMVYADALSYFIVLFLVIYSTYTLNSFYLDIAIVFVMFSFLATVAIAKYVVEKNV